MLTGFLIEGEGIEGDDGVVGLALPGDAIHIFAVYLHHLHGQSLLFAVNSVPILPRFCPKENLFPANFAHLLAFLPKTM